MYGVFDCGGEPTIQRSIEESLDPADNLLRTEGFGDVSNRTDLSPAQDVGGKPSRREHDDRKVLGPGVAAQTCRQVETVCRGGEGDVEEDQIHVLFAEETFSILGGLSLENDVAFPAKFVGQDSPNMRLVLDNQNSAPHIKILRLRGFQINSR